MGGGTSSCCSAADTPGDAVHAQVIAQPPPMKEPEPCTAGTASETKQPAGRIGFQRQDGSKVFVTFQYCPLGMALREATPVTVKGVFPDGAAESLGIQKGWIVAEVSGVDTTRMDMPQVRK